MTFWGYLGVFYGVAFAVWTVGAILTLDSRVRKLDRERVASEEVA